MNELSQLMSNRHLIVLGLVSIILLTVLIFSYMLFKISSFLKIESYDFKLLIQITDSYPKVILENEKALENEDFFLGIVNALEQLKIKDFKVVNYLLQGSLLVLSDNPILMDGLAKSIQELSQQENLGQYPHGSIKFEVKTPSNQ